MGVGRRSLIFFGSVTSAAHRCRVVFNLIVTTDGRKTIVRHVLTRSIPSRPQKQLDGDYARPIFFNKKVRRFLGVYRGGGFLISTNLKGVLVILTVFNRSAD